MIVTEKRVVVVEVKASRLPVRGELDGDWERRELSGRWHRYTNAYQQACGIKNRLRDAMGRHGDIGRFYPDAAVVFLDPPPLGSALTHGNFKVAITDLSQFQPAASGAQPNPWTLNEWRAFSSALSLRPASLCEVLAGTALEPAFNLLRDYRQRLEADLDHDGDRWLPEDDNQREALIRALDYAPGCYVAGPSGCGKTLGVRRAAAHLSRSGECVIFLAAKDFSGSWADLLKRELALMIEVTPSMLVRAIRATGCPVRIVLDGINELGANRDIALRGLHAMSRRLDARVIVTGQSALPDQLAGLVEVAVPLPSLDLKQRIVSTRLPAISGSLRALLKAIKSGFEAAIVAEIGADVQLDASRQLLVDQFIRTRLGSSRTAGSAGLRRFARFLIETTNFSMSETAFEELMTSTSVTSADMDAMFAGAVLSRRGGRVSFAHEILLNACAAFGFAQQAAAASETFADLLALPALAPLAADILSVIEDAGTVSVVLGATRDHALLYEAAHGLAGPIARQAANALLEQTEVAIENEIGNLRLAIVAGENPSVNWQEGTLREWSPTERARTAALAQEIGTGHRSERYFQLCAAMDAVLHAERCRLYDAATAAGIRALRSDSFRLAYSPFGSETGFAKISQMATSGMFDIVDPLHINGPRDMLSLTSGQLYFYLERRRLFLDHVEVDDVANGLKRVISERFRREPYLVKLAILHAATFVRSASPEKVEGLIEAIQEIDANRESLWISTAIIDALKYLGALQESAEDARNGIAAEFGQILSADENDLIRTQALSVSTAMFDHPYDGIYGELFETLSKDDRRSLLRRAARAPEARRSVFISWVLREISSFNDPADITIMQEFARLPDPGNVMPQEEWGAFIVAIRFLGCQGLELPPLEGKNETERALVQVRTLLYATEDEAKCGLADGAWVALGKLSVPAVMGCLTEMEDALREQHWSEQHDVKRASLARLYSSQCLDLARRFLDGGVPAQYFHMAYSHDRASNLAFAIIELFGDRSDLPRLQRLANGSPLASQALGALRKLDSI